MCVVFDTNNCLSLHRKMRFFVQMLPWYSLSVFHVHIQVIQLIIRCGNRKMAKRIELIFTMETDSPVLDRSPDSQR